VCSIGVVCSHIPVPLFTQASTIFFFAKSQHHGLVRLASCQPASSAFLSHQFSISHQPPVSQQYFSLTTNQPQLPATSQPNEAHIVVCAASMHAVQSVMEHKTPIHPSLKASHTFSSCQISLYIHQIHG
jgi:hypothetical protein